MFVFSAALQLTQTTGHKNKYNSVKNTDDFHPHRAKQITHPCTKETMVLGRRGSVVQPGVTVATNIVD